MSKFRNLSKTFRYVNELGGEIIFEYDSGFLINKPVGIDTVNVSLSRAKGINQIGESIQAINVNSRPINITGILVGDFQAEGKEKLLSVIRPDIKARLYADDYFLEVYPTSTPTIEAAPKFAHFGFSLLAPYSYWQAKNKEIIPLNGLAYRFRFPVNFSKPYRFAEYLDTKFINVPNRGQMPVPFRATFYARNTCINPKVTNVETGEFLQIEKTLALGERVVVDITHDRTHVISSVDGDIRGALTLESNLFALAVGDNILMPGAESGLKELQVTIEFAKEKVGVSV